MELTLAERRKEFIPTEAVYKFVEKIIVAVRVRILPSRLSDEEKEDILWNLHSTPGGGNLSRDRGHEKPRLHTTGNAVASTVNVMPTPCTSSEGWEAVKATAIARGSLKEAAALHGLPYSAAKQRAWRERWPVGRRLAQAVLDAKEAEQRRLALLNPQSVTHVTSSSEALIVGLANDRETSRAHLGQYSAKAAKAVALDPDPLSVTRQARDISSIAASLWPERNDPGISIQILNPAEWADSHKC